MGLADGEEGRQTSLSQVATCEREQPLDRQGPKAQLTAAPGSEETPAMLPEEEVKAPTESPPAGMRGGLLTLARGSPTRQRMGKQAQPHGGPTFLLEGGGGDHEESLTQSELTIS